jgi:type II secretory pathway component PulJ
MKKILIALVLAGGVGAIAYASFSSNRHSNQAIEKKTEKKDKKHECNRTCMFT